MRRWLWVPVLVLVRAGSASAQVPTCGPVSTTTTVRQAFDYQLRVHVTAQTTRNIDGCTFVLSLRLESWVEGLDMMVMTAEGGRAAASIDYEWAVPSYRTWVGQTKHWAILYGFSWMWLGQSSGEGTVVPRPADEPPPPPSDEPLPMDSGDTDPNCPSCGTPLLLDPAFDGFRLTSVDDGVLFDLDGDGTLDRVAWTEAGSDDAWLAMDRNGNGVIDDGTELFGDMTPAYPNQRLPRTKDGFAALGFLQLPEYGSNVADQSVNWRDEVYQRLLVWTDRNHNGISEPDELQGARDAGLVALKLRSRPSNRRDEFGNLYRLKGHNTWRVTQDDGSVTYEQGTMWDVWLQVRAR